MGGGRIGISDIKSYLVGAGGRNTVFVKVETDAGLHGGTGEAYSCGPDEATAAVSQQMARLAACVVHSHLLWDRHP